MREMWGSKGNGELENRHSSVAVAVDKDKGSQIALKWALDNLVPKGGVVTLVHVKTKQTSHANNDLYAKEVLLPFRCFCSRKDIQCNDILLDDTEIAKAVVEYAAQNVIEKLVVGSPNRSAFARFKSADVTTAITKGAPDFCTVYVISKGKVLSVRNAIRQAPVVPSALRPHMQQQSHSSARIEKANPPLPRGDREMQLARQSFEEKETIRSPFTRGGRGPNAKSYGELSMPETDISFVSSGRPSTDRMFPSLYDDGDFRPPRLSNSSGSDGFDRSSFETSRSSYRSPIDAHMMGLEYSSSSQSGLSSWSSQTMDDVEAEMRRLKLELKQTMDMYSTACKEALTANQKAGELHRWKADEEQRLHEARLAHEAALAAVDREKAKCKVAIEAAEAAQRIAELEAQKRINAEMKAFKESEEKKKAVDALVNNDLRYRKYSIDEIESATEYFAQSRKIGEGGYGPVYKCHLDHTQVAIKVLRPDAAQGRSQFQQEVEVLSCIRHPNMVLLLGACPEYGCLVYEYMANGSLEDRLFRRGNTPVVPWQLRFRIAAEIGTALLFLHQTKPEPLVHRDLKPANILLDRNYVSKISDVGLARLVPPSVADNVTQYRMTSTAGTFCYIDPEYQQTGMLGVKSDMYSLGIMLLQMITAKPPMGLTHHVERAIERGTFEEMLDPAVKDWPVEEAMTFAKLALQCAELRRKDRPDLGNVVLPELNRLRTLAEDSISAHGGFLGGRQNPSTDHGHSNQEFTSEPSNSLQSGSSRPSRASMASSMAGTGRRTGAIA